MSADSQTDVWCVQDAAGVIHRAQVRRFFNEARTRVVHVNVSLACMPRVMSVENVSTSHWLGARLPPIQLHDQKTVITTWRIHEDPTCLTCISVAVPVSWMPFP